MMKLKVRTVGNSAGVLFPKELQHRLKVAPGDELFATETPEGILLTPYSPDFEEQLAAAQKGMAKYRNALRELAK